MPENQSLYLQHLKFDERLKNSFIARYFANTRLILLIIMSLMVVGVMSFLSLPRELNPEVDLAIVNVITTLPGAAPLDVENLVTKKIEKELTNISNIDVISSVSRESVSAITIQFLGNQDSDEALDEVQQKVDIVTDLPEDATEPLVQKLDFNDQPVWQVALSSDTDRLSLSRIGKNLETLIEAESGVRKVELTGIEENEVVVELDKQAIIEMGISSSQIVQAIRSNDVNFPAGRMTVNDLEYTLTIDNEFNTVDQLRQLPLSVQGQQIALGQIADVYIRSKESSVPSFFYKDGVRKAAVQLSIYKTEDETIDGAYQTAKSVIDEQLQFYPQVEQFNILNFSEETTKAFDDLQGNFISSVAMIFFALSIFLGVRQAVIAAISLPLTLMATFTIMGISGVTMNFLAIFSLLLALSLIGDDAIVIVQSSKEYQQKFRPFQASLLVFRDYFLPIWTGTLTVVWSFVPLLLASGIIGKFIRPIPIVVSATLLSSVTIATLINLPLNAVLAELNIPARLKFLLLSLVTLGSFGFMYLLVERSPYAAIVLITYILVLVVTYIWRKTLVSDFNFLQKNLSKRLPEFRAVRNWFDHHDVLSKPIIDISPLSKKYYNMVLPIIKKKKSRWMVYAVMIVIVLVSFFFAGSGMLKNEFFPKTDGTILYVNVEGPAGWKKEKTQEALNSIQDIINAVPGVKHAFVQTGTSASSAFDGSGGGNNTGSYTLTLIDATERDQQSFEIASDLRKVLSRRQDATFTVVEQEGGPPAGSDFQANIKGEDLEVLEEISKEFMSTLNEIDHATNIQSSLKLSAGQIHVDLIPAELSKRNLSSVQVGDWLRTAVTGLNTGDIVINSDDVDVIVSLQEDTQTINYLQNLVIPSQSGTYTLSEVAQLRLEQSPNSISREDGKRVVRVSAGTSNGLTAPELLQRFNEKIADYDLPAGYTWDVGGANEENQESVNSILRAMGVSFVLILVTMVLLLSSFRQALMVLSIIPLSIAGVFINFTIFGIPLSFPALIGVLALFGIVVNNAIMLMDKINQNMREKFSLYEGVADACASRIEPIFLTAITGILGLIPVTISDPLWRGLGGAIVAGLSVSGVFVLFLIPSLYIEVFGKEYLKKNS